MQQNISICIDYLVYKDNSKKNLKKNALLNILLLQWTPRDGAIGLLKL
jgi:phosphoribosyl 1,2-cyclic phosphodiesterase